MLHVIAYSSAAFANTMCELVLTGPRASTPDIFDTPDDDVLEPYPQSPVVQLTGAGRCSSATMDCSTLRDLLAVTMN